MTLFVYLYLASDLFILNYIKRVKIKYINIIRANKFVFKLKMLTDFNNDSMKRDCQCKREDEVYKHFPSNILECRSNISPKQLNCDYMYTYIITQVNNNSNNTR